VERLTLERARARHAEGYRAGGAFLVLVGDITPDRAVEMAGRHLGAWQGGRAEAPPPATPAPLPATMVHLVDKPGAAQGEVRIAQPGVARSHPDYYPILMMNAILGEAFGSRLFFNLREKHGYTYGVSSYFSMRRGPGPFVAASAVQTSVTDSAVIEF